MIIYSVIISLITIFYGVLMLWYWYGWRKAKEQSSISENITTSVTIVIAARNEEEHISKCIEDIINQQFPTNLLEIIVVDDHSTDGTPEIVKGFVRENLKLIQLKDPENSIFPAYKKKAVETAIDNASGKLIITTDADCRMEPLWLASIVSYYQSNSYKVIAAPVVFRERNNLFEQFQALDFLGLMGITCGSIFHQFPVMCNGANLAYEKQAFFDVNGFEGIDDVASGDDMLLMHKLFKKYPHSVGFLKSNTATVYTFPQESVAGFFRQRSRWTSKSTHYSDKRITAILVIAYLFNLSLLINFIAWPFGELFIKLLLAQLIIKFITEYILLSSVASFFKRKDLLSVFLPAQLMHICYVLVIGIAGITTKQQWKGRDIK